MVVALKERNGSGNVAAMHRPHEPKSRNTEQKKGNTQQKAASIGTVLLFDWNHLSFRSANKTSGEQSWRNVLQQSR